MRPGTVALAIVLLLSASTTVNAPSQQSNSLNTTPSDGSSLPIRFGPVAAFTYIPCVVCAVVGDAIFFNASYSASPFSHIIIYTWNFGDGSPLAKTTDPTISHIYPGQPGQWQVTLTIYDSRGRSDTVSQLVMFQALPTFAIQPSEIVLPGPFAFAFNATESKSYDPQNPIKDYFWTFGDGANATGKVVQHTYRLPGIYRVQLSLITTNGSPQVSKTVRVPNFIFTSTFHGLNVTATGSVAVNSTSQTITATISVSVVNATTGQEVFSRTFNVTIAYSSGNPPGFLLVSAATLYRLGLGCMVNTGTSDTSCILSKDPDIADQPIVNILDVATIAFSFGSTSNNANWNSDADLNADGRVSINDVAIAAIEWGMQVFR